MTTDERNNTKFTPGPWRMPPCCTIHMDKPHCEERYSPLVKSGADVVCGLVNVRVADAALITECPNMYALLIDLRDNYVQDPNGIRKINEQLARCRGENDD